MDTNRIVNMVLTELSLENLMFQENLETAINSSDEAAVKITKIKANLKGLTTNEMMITKFQSLITKPELKSVENG